MMCAGGFGNDLISILDGEDIDHVDGGAGIDTLDLSGIINPLEAVTISYDAIVPGPGTFTGKGGTRDIQNFEVIFGTQGDDQIEHDRGSDQLYGEGGNDLLDGGLDRDFIYGGTGNDTVRVTLGPADNVFGGAGEDTLELFGSAVTINRSIPDGTNVWESATGGPATIEGFEIIRGTEGNDVIRYDEGQNTIFGNGGDDVIIGGQGIDNARGGEGNDTIRIFDNDFIDNVFGGAGIDTLDLSDISGFGQAVSISFNSGTGVYDFTGFGGVTILAGVEIILGTGLSDIIHYDNGDDVLEGGDGDDDLAAGSGADTVRGDGGDDVVRLANAGFTGDAYYGGTGSDLIDAGAVVLLAGSDGLDFDLAGGTLSSLLGGSAPLGEFEHVIATSLDDTIIGTGDDNRITGGGGSDLIEGGAGTDTAVYGANRAAYIITTECGDVVVEHIFSGDIDYVTNVEFFEFADMTIATPLDPAMTLIGTPGNDVLTGGNNNDEIAALGGNDYAYGGEGIDLIFGDGGDDRLYGGDCPDEIYGGQGVDLIFGGAGGDDLFGGLGDDRILVMRR